MTKCFLQNWTFSSLCTHTIPTGRPRRGPGAPPPPPPPQAVGLLLPLLPTVRFGTLLGGLRRRQGGQRHGAMGEEHQILLEGGEEGGIQFCYKYSKKMMDHLLCWHVTH